MFYRKAINVWHFWPSYFVNLFPTQVLNLVWQTLCTIRIISLLRPSIHPPSCVIQHLYVIIFFFWTGALWLITELVFSWIQTNSLQFWNLFIIPRIFEYVSLHAYVYNFLSRLLMKMQVVFKWIFEYLLLVMVICETRD